MRAARLIPLADAVRQLDIRAEHPSRWLIKRLKRLKREAGVDLLVKVGEGQKRPRYRVSLSRIRRYMPELFDVEAEREDFAKAAAVAFGRIERKLETIDDRVDSTEQRLGAIHMHLVNRPKNSHAR